MIILELALGLVAMRYLTRRPKHDPTIGGRLVARNASLHAQIVAAHRAEHEAFASKHTLKLGD